MQILKAEFRLTLMSGTKLFYPGILSANTLTNFSRFLWLPQEATTTTAPAQKQKQLSQPSPAPKTPSGFQPVELETSPSPLPAATP